MPSCPKYWHKFGWSCEVHNFQNFEFNSYFCFASFLVQVLPSLNPMLTKHWRHYSCIKNYKPNLSSKKFPVDFIQKRTKIVVSLTILESSGGRSFFKFAWSCEVHKFQSFEISGYFWFAPFSVEVLASLTPMLSGHWRHYSCIEDYKPNWNSRKFPVDFIKKGPR